ncbi:BQ2448_1399 [Microbotryum intermedium]|uniref:BQ2448_1399 protein n=1 Tax=Microbotryum intermedium TaxID=269621 RepID=A0A238F9W3_9BASI|nr:BQ2448_1399 [Microbotryum intermedium]
MVRIMHSPESPTTSPTTTKVERPRTYYASRTLPRVAPQPSLSTPTRTARRIIQPENSLSLDENCGYIDFGSVTNRLRTCSKSDVALRKSTRRAPARSFNSMDRNLPTSSVSSAARSSSSPTSFSQDALVPSSPTMASPFPASVDIHLMPGGFSSLGGDRAPSPSTSSHFADALDVGESCRSSQRATEEQGRYSLVEAFEYDFEDESHPFFGNELTQFLQQLQDNDDSESRFRDECFAAATESTSSSGRRDPASPQVARKQLALAQSTWSPLESPSNALSLPFHLHQAQFPKPPQTRPLVLQPSVGTLRAQSPSPALPSGSGLASNPSFFETPFFDLDIDAILTAYEAVSSDEDKQDEQDEYDINFTIIPKKWSIKPAARQDSSSYRAVARTRKPIFPSPSPRANPDLRDLRAVFPSHAASLRPQKSSTLSLQTASLSLDATVNAPPPLPLPAPPAHLASDERSATHLSPAAALSRQSTFSSTVSSSNVSSPISTRSSGFSSNSNDSFRWSVVSGSTAYTMADGDGLDALGRCFPSPVKRVSDSSIYSTVSSVAPVLPSTGSPRRVRLPGANFCAGVDRRDMVCTEGDAMMDWQQFAEEMCASLEDSVDITLSVAKSSPLPPPPFAFARTATTTGADCPSPASFTSTLPLPGVAPTGGGGPRSLVKKMSSLSLKRFKRGVVGSSSSTPAPPMPQYASNLVMMHSMHFS